MVNRQVRAAKETIDEVPVAAEGTEAYSPATTWDGLEHVGGYGGWWEKNWDPEHGFKASMWWVPTIQNHTSLGWNIERRTTHINIVSFHQNA
jgi:hypothetical protein